MRDVSEVCDRGDTILLGEVLRHDIGVLIRGGGGVEDSQVGGCGVDQGGVDILFASILGVGAPVLQEWAGVLGEEVDRAGFDLREVDLALTDSELAFDGVPGFLERLGVDLRDDLVGVLLL